MSAVLLQLTFVSFYLAVLGHVLSIISLLISMCIFSYFKYVIKLITDSHQQMFV